MPDVRILESVHIADPTTGSQQASVDSSGRLTVVVGDLPSNQVASSDPIVRRLLEQILIELKLMRGVEPL